MKRAIDDRLVAELTLDGWPNPLIAKTLHFSVRTVQRSRVRAGVARPASRPITDNELDLIQRMLADGRPLTQVASMLGRDRDVLHRRLKNAT